MLEFYVQPGPFTLLPEDFEPASLPGDLPALVQIVQNMMIHVFWAEKYGIKLSETRNKELNLRSCKDKIDRLRNLQDIPIAEKRDLDKKLVGNCRDFSLVLAAFLKSKGIPARARCGFAKYLLPGHYEDHWVTEYWNAQEQRWVMVDAQLDELQQRTLKIRFNPLDVPAYQFINGGKAWLLCRTGQANPDDFGIFEMHGLWFVRGDLMRDFLALNNLEILPWDAYGLIAKHDNQINEKDIELLDQVAGFCLDPQGSFTEIRNLFETNQEMKLPAFWYH